MAEPLPVALSMETEAGISNSFPPQDRAEVRALLLEYGTAAAEREVERVRFDILHLAAGELEKVRRLVALAQPRLPRSLERGVHAH